MKNAVFCDKVAQTCAISFLLGLFRVPEEKQMMFLPGILEEEEESTTVLTPRTSTASLANPNDSPMNERR